MARITIIDFISRRKTEESDEQVAVVRRAVPSVPVRRWGDAALPPTPPSEIGSTKDPSSSGFAGWGSLESGSGSGRVGWVGFSCVGL